MKKRALISVSDKTGVVDAAKKLVELGYEIISTGGTQKSLEDAGVPTVNISDITGFPECLDGRVKTLHPAVHAGLLAMRSNPEHMAQLEKLGLNTIDVVIVNLYPFKQTVMRGAEFAEAVENIDIGGPTMLRSAAKNYQDVAVVVDPADYDRLFLEMQKGEVSLDTRKYLMYKVFQHTAVYDTLISTYLRQQLDIKFPEQLTLAYEKKEQMRYGENPHQEAAFYGDAVPVKNSLVNAVQLNGKQLSYNNINDTNGAVELLKEFSEPTIVAVKHANPCGVASADDIKTAYLRAYDADPVSIFGGIVAANREIDGDTAREMKKIFLEIVIAPSFTDEALEEFKTKQNLRVLQLADVAKPNDESLIEFKKVYGGLIMQGADNGVYSELKTVTKKAPTKAEQKTMEFGMKVVKHCKSNAIVIVKDSMTLGIGVGQTNRIWATKQAGEHSINGCKGAVLASDAFFPFDDCVTAAAEMGVTAIVQPGGSMRDEDSIKAADSLGLSMCFTGVRHFKH